MRLGCETRMWDEDVRRGCETRMWDEDVRLGRWGFGRGVEVTDRRRENWPDSPATCMLIFSNSMGVVTTIWHIPAPAPANISRPKVSLPLRNSEMYYRLDLEVKGYTIRRIKYPIKGVGYFWYFWYFNPDHVEYMNCTRL